MPEITVKIRFDNNDSVSTKALMGEVREATENVLAGHGIGVSDE